MMESKFAQGAAPRSVPFGTPGPAVNGHGGVEPGRAVLSEYVILAVREGSAHLGLPELAHAFLSVLPHSFTTDDSDTMPIDITSQDVETTVVVRTLTIRLCALQDGRRLLEACDHSTNEKATLVAHGGWGSATDIRG
jgi:hypothetical protein